MDRNCGRLTPALGHMEYFMAFAFFCEELWNLYGWLLSYIKNDIIFTTKPFLRCNRGARYLQDRVIIMYFT